MENFNPKKCIIPEIWCGNSKVPPNKKDKVYYKTGSRYECMKKGFGSGMNSEKKNNLPENSLQNIKYIGDVHEGNFKKAGINTIANLIAEMRSRTSKDVEKILKKILLKSNNIPDQKAYNSTLLFLYNNGNSNLPQCIKINFS